MITARGRAPGSLHSGGATLGRWGRGERGGGGSCQGVGRVLPGFAVPDGANASDTDVVTGRRIRVGIDTGGTFTDVVAVDEDSGELLAVKTPSTPADPAEGFLTGIRKALAALDAGPADL